MMYDETQDYPVEVPEKSEEPADYLQDLFEGPKPDDSDMAIDHLVELSDEEELDDLFDVSVEGIMGEAPPPKIRRTGKPYIPRQLLGTPPIGMGGMRGEE